MGPGRPGQHPGRDHRRREGNGQERRVPIGGGPRQDPGATGGGQERTLHALGARHPGRESPGGPAGPGTYTAYYSRPLKYLRTIHVTHSINVLC